MSQRSHVRCGHTLNHANGRQHQQKGGSSTQHYIITSSGNTTDYSNISNSNPRQLYTLKKVTVAAIVRTSHRYSLPLSQLPATEDELLQEPPPPPPPPPAAAGGYLPNTSSQLLNQLLNPIDH